MNSSSVKTPLFTILFIFLALFVYTSIAGPIPFSVRSIATTKDSLFKVEGTGKATAVPNTAQISVGVTKNAPSVTDAQNQVNNTSAKIIAGLKNIGVEEKNITTTNYSVNPTYDYTNGTQKVIGYSVTQTIEVKISPVEKANAVVDLATQNGANIISGVQFVLDDSSKKKLLKEAREKAVVEAKEKASDLASAAGIKLGKIVDIQENNAQPDIVQPLAMARDEKTVVGSTPTQITPGESTVNVTITLSYETY